MKISQIRVGVGLGAVALLGGGVTWLVWPAGNTPATANPTQATCPTTHTRMASNPRSADLARQLVPSHPTGATVCGYTTNPWATSAPARTATIGGDQAEQLAAALNAGQVFPPGEITTCPKDDGTSDMVLFTYPTGRTVQVAVERTGCGFAANGFDPAEESTTVWMTVEAQQQLANLVG